MRLENIREILASELIRKRINGVRKRQSKSEKRKFTQEMNHYIKKEERGNHYLPQEKKESEEIKKGKKEIKAIKIYKTKGKEEKIEKGERKGQFLDIKI